MVQTPKSENVGPKGRYSLNFNRYWPITITITYQKFMLPATPFDTSVSLHPHQHALDMRGYTDSHGYYNLYFPDY